MNHMKPGAPCLGTQDRHTHGLGRLHVSRLAGDLIRLNRFRGRWLILRVTEAPDGALLPGLREGVDGVALNVFLDPASVNGKLNGHCPETIAIDHAGAFRRCFPQQEWPATFIVDPVGELVAILSDECYEPFVQSLIRDGRMYPSFGRVEAIDRTDLKL